MQPGQGCDTVSMAADADADDTDGGDSDDDDDDWQAMILLLRMQEENRPQKCASQVELVSGMQGSRRVNFATANLGMCKELQACLALPNGKHTSEMSKKSKLGLKLDYPFKAPVHEVVHLAPCIEALLGWQVFVTASARTLDIGTVLINQSNALVITSPEMKQHLLERFDKHIFPADKVQSSGTLALCQCSFHRCEVLNQPAASNGLLVAWVAGSPSAAPGPAPAATDQLQLISCSTGVASACKELPNLLPTTTPLTLASLPGSTLPDLG
eukprot:1140327-Pelagomonas_calceolata.AAC.7